MKNRLVVGRKKKPSEMQWSCLGWM